MRGLRHRLRGWIRRDAEPKQGLSVAETFLCLRPWQRVACVVCAIAAYVICVQSTFSANVAPHVATITAPDGSFRVGEFVAALTLASSVILLSASTLLMPHASWFGRVGIAVMAVVIAYTNVNNACIMQRDARETRNEGPRQKIERIEGLDKAIGIQETAYRQVPQHDYVTQPMVDVAAVAAQALAKSAHDECHTGVSSNTRGTRCEGLEKRRDAKLEEVATLQHNADLTKRAAHIEVELTKLRDKRDAEGAKPEITGRELEPVPELLADFGFPVTGKALSNHKPTTDAIMMELEAWFAAPVSVIAIIKLFGLLCCTRGEAERRVIQVTQAVMDERAKEALAADEPDGITLDDAPEAPAPYGFEEMEPDAPTPEDVLGIEGEHPPGFCTNPETVAEAAAAAMLKADPHKKRTRKARVKKEANPDSVLQWFKERVIQRDGRDTYKNAATKDYNGWCADMNLSPVSPKMFGVTLSKELGIRKDCTGKKYIGMGIMPASLRVVSG